MTPRLRGLIGCCLAAFLATGCASQSPATTVRQLASLRYGMSRDAVAQTTGTSGSRYQMLRLGGSDYSAHVIGVRGRSFTLSAVYADERLFALLPSHLEHFASTAAFPASANGYVAALRKQRLALDERTIAESVAGKPEPQFPIWVGVPLLALSVPAIVATTPEILTAPRLGRAWDRLRLGMSLAEVERLAGKPEHSVRATKPPEVLWYYEDGVLGFSRGVLVLATRR